MPESMHSPVAQHVKAMLLTVTPGDVATWGAFLIIRWNEDLFTMANDKLVVIGSLEQIMTVVDSLQEQYGALPPIPYPVPEPMGPPAPQGGYHHGRLN